MTMLAEVPASEPTTEAQPEQAAAIEQAPPAENEPTVRALKALSLWEPWASLIRLNEKKTETRSWGTSYRGPVAILSTKDLKPEAREAAAAGSPIAEALARHGLTLEQLPLGCVQCVADLVDDVEFTDGYDPGEPERHFGDFRPGRHGFKLENVRVLPEPIPCAGARGLFDLPDDVAARVWAALEAPAVEAEAEAPAAPAPESEKVGSRTISYEEQERHLQEIEEAERVVAAREEEWEELKTETKTAKDAFDAAVERLRKVIRSHKPGFDPLFSNLPNASKPAADITETITEAKPERPLALEWSEAEEDGEKYWVAQFGIGGEVQNFIVDQADDGDHKFWSIDGSDSDVLDGFEVPEEFESREAAQAECQKIANKLWEAEHGQPLKTPAPADDTAWRSVPLGTLPGIPPKKLQLLADHEPPITTMGELADWQGKKGDPWWWKDLRGMGEGGMTAIVEAQAAYWQANPREKAPEAPAAADDQADACPNDPASSAETFTEDAVDYATRETVAEIQQHLLIETARRTSGRWQSGYMVLVGKLDKSRPIGISPTFATKAEAVVDAIDAIGGVIIGANGELKGKAAKVATQIRAALEAARKTA